MDNTSTDASGVIPALEHVADGVSSDEIPALLGNLERIKTRLTARMLREAVAAPATRTAPLGEDLRHLTPTQVAELLNLKEPYIHELCRSRKLPAVKSGKYWMIPLDGLRDWLVSQRGDIDDAAKARLASANVAAVAPSHSAAVARRRRSAPARTREVR